MQTKKEVEMTKVGEKIETRGDHEVDWVKEEAGSRNKVKHIEKISQLFVEKTM